MKRTTITPRLFDAVKVLLESGSDHQEIANHLKIHVNTVHKIAAAETLEEYRQMDAMRRAMYAKNKAKREQEKETKPEPQAEEPVVKTEKLPGGSLSANYQINRIYEEQRKMNELLTLISAKLAAIVEELT